jgi:hypothetical protein
LLQRRASIKVGERLTRIITKKEDINTIFGVDLIKINYNLKPEEKNGRKISK